MNWHLKIVTKNLHMSLQKLEAPASLLNVSIF